MSAFDDLERRSSVELPTDYAAFLLEADERLSPGGTVYADPEYVLVKTLELRSPEREFPPTLAPHHLCIGDDGCGNLLVCDTRRGRLLFWDHEADALEDRGELRVALAGEKTVRRHPEARPGLLISRVRPAWKSILDPITRAEWTAVAERDPELRFPAHREGRNPFTREVTTFACPFRAQWVGNPKGQVHERGFLSLHDGRIELEGSLDGRNEDTELREKMARLAAGLRAQLLEVA